MDRDRAVVTKFGTELQPTRDGPRQALCSHPRNDKAHSCELG